MNYDLFISLVQSFPHLYDKSNKNFKNNIIRDNSWTEIGLALHMSRNENLFSYLFPIIQFVYFTATDCQRIWKNLRDKYTREKRAIPSGAEAPSEPQWEYFHALRFLDEHIRRRKYVLKMTKVEMLIFFLINCRTHSSIRDSTANVSEMWSSMSQITSETEEIPQEILEVQADVHSEDHRGEISNFFKT